MVLLKEKVVSRMQDQKTLDFIKNAEFIHGVGTYDYSKSTYINSKTKLIVICPKHNFEFEPTPSHFLRGSRCPKCGRESGNSKQVKTTEDFIKDAKDFHGDTYNYNKSVYVNKYTNLIITCSIHGDFEQTPSTHLRADKSCGCPKCGFVKIGDKSRSSTEEFINKSISRYGKDIFNYSNVKYINDKTAVTLICKKHNYKFDVIPGNHYRGAGGCIKCQASSGEINIRNFLLKNNIKFEEQKGFEDCKNKKVLKFDFYLFNHNTVIEFQGRQHFESVNYFGGEEGFKLVQERDNIKKQYCLVNNINLVELTDSSKESIFKALSIYG